MSVYVGFKIGKARERKAYISECYCGACGWPVSDHDSYCPECGGAFRKEDATERTCHAVEKGNPDEHHVCYGCSVCSFGWYEDVYDEPYRYCPHCGARMVDNE